ncbi:meprin A subunit beta-like isoform X2 [Mizuhopecten yessoensis]|uniref:meprin A subunit beta-like isoform X2 n=1 Tax=Mizuhopecten yessoensis TaxID=6573 RepID=UPI000B45EEE8|nr:meprin A subunit beta-like isoform X2 [Mizuhopecten yessoensis]
MGQLLSRHRFFSYVCITLAPDGWCRTDHIGMAGGRQKLYLNNDCMFKRDIMSLLLVTLGLYHEHQRPDRDQYIQVHLDNVQDIARTLFGKVPAGDTDLLSFPYDFDSITHFSPYAYAKDPHHPTITTTISAVPFGNKRMLSYHDVLKVQTLYICGKDTSHIINSPALAVNCDFESFLCNLADDYQDDFKWIRQSSPLGQNGPTADHSSGSGFYLFANGTGHHNRTARLLSAREIPPGEYCISMHYYIVGNATATLTVRSYDYVDDTEKTLSSRTTNQGSNVDGGWYQYRTFISKMDHKWRIYIEGYITNEVGGVAIDDVQVYPGVCS